MLRSLSVSGSVTLRKVCAWNTSADSGLICGSSLSTAMMMWSAVMLPPCVYTVWPSSRFIAVLS